MAKLPDSIDDYQAPWEKSGEEIDAEKAKKLLYNALRGEEKAKADLVTERANTKTEKDRADAAEAEKAKADRKDESELQRVQRELDEAKSKADKADAQEHENLRLQIAVEKGLDARQLKRLTGKDREELEADADELLEVIPSTKKVDDDNDDDDDQGDNEPNPLDSRPRRNPGDRKTKDTPSERSVDDFLKQYDGQSY